MLRQADIPTQSWFDGRAPRLMNRFAGRSAISGAALCSVVPRATPQAARDVLRRWKIQPLRLTHATVRGVGIDYPKPATIGPDRLANAVAARHHFGAPVVVVDFGTADTFDVVNRQGNYIDRRNGFIGIRYRLKCSVPVPRENPAATLDRKVQAYRMESARPISSNTVLIVVDFKSRSPRACA